MSPLIEHKSIDEIDVNVSIDGSFYVEHDSGRQKDIFISPKDNVSRLMLIEF